MGFIASLFFWFSSYAHFASSIEALSSNVVTSPIGSREINTFKTILMILPLLGL